MEDKYYIKDRYDVSWRKEGKGNEKGRPHRSHRSETERKTASLCRIDHHIRWKCANQFQSDFREVARYFVQMRENGEYQPSDDELQHIESVLQLLNVMDKDHRFETEINERKTGKEVRKMSEWLTRVINENQAIGRVEGRAEGRAEGKAEGEFSMLVTLVRKNLLSVKDAAEQAGMTETAFCEKAGMPVRQ